MKYLTIALFIILSFASCKEKATPVVGVRSPDDSVYKKRLASLDSLHPFMFVFLDKDSDKVEEMSGDQNSMFPPPKESGWIPVRQYVQGDTTVTFFIIPDSSMHHATLRGRFYIIKCPLENLFDPPKDTRFKKGQISPRLKDTIYDVSAVKINLP